MMTEPKIEYPPGILCPKCGGTDWHIATTRRSKARVRRWRKCLTCSHTVRTVEVIESAQIRPRKASA